MRDLTTLERLRTSNEMGAYDGVRWRLAWLVGLMLCVPSLVWAQTAADKATAREQAKQGIELFRAESYAEALDKLKRAQALYDAPVHLLYIARCQAQLGKLVEASETYRTLSYTQLEAGAPTPFVQAVRDGETELGQVQARIPKLLIRVTPADAPNPSVRIDDRELPAAVIGIERPINPGNHSVTVSADGYAATTQGVVATEGQLTEVALVLTQAEGDGSEDPTAQTADGEADEDADGAQPLSAGDDPDPGAALPWGLVLGLRLGAGVPAGKLPGRTINNPDATVAFADHAGLGGELELRGGARILNHFGMVAFASGSGFTDKDVGGNSAYQLGGVSMLSLGLAAVVGTKPGTFGAYGELGVALRAVSFPVTSGLVRPCSADVSLTGAAVRLFAALNIALSDAIQLTPYAGASFGGFNKQTVTDSNDCISALGGLGADELSGDIEDSPSAVVVSLGVGGEYYIGIR